MQRLDGVVTLIRRRNDVIHAAAKVPEAPTSTVNPNATPLASPWTAELNRCCEKRKLTLSWTTDMVGPHHAPIHTASTFGKHHHDVVQNVNLIRDL